MPRTPARFTQADITRALRAIKQTGADMVVEIRPDGVIRIVPRGLAANRDKNEPDSEPEREIIL